MMNMVTSDDKTKGRVELEREIAEGDLHVAVLAERTKGDSKGEPFGLAHL